MSPSADLVVLDGSQGEGGGQIVRTALGLSLVTSRPVRIDNVRARRSRPGLLRQHLTAVLAAAEIGRARVSGAKLGSRSLEFHPEHARAGNYRFAIGTAGSTTLVAQTVLWALLDLDAPSAVRIEGGTHNPLAPSFDFFQRAFLPLLRRMGANVTCELERYGFHPKGGGAIELRVRPTADSMRPIELLDRGPVTRRVARAIVADLPESIAEREAKVLIDKLGSDSIDVRREVVANGPGNAVIVDVESAALTEVVTSLGAIRVPAERVAARAVRDVRAYERAGVPVGPQLADQLLIPLALAGGGSFSTVLPTDHTQTNARIVEAFLPVSIELHDRGDSWRIDVRA